MADQTFAKAKRNATIAIAAVQTLNSLAFDAVFSKDETGVISNTAPMAPDDDDDDTKSPIAGAPPAGHEGTRNTNPDGSPKTAEEQFEQIEEKQRINRKRGFPDLIAKIDKSDQNAKKARDALKGDITGLFSNDDDGLDSKDSDNDNDNESDGDE